MKHKQAIYYDRNGERKSIKSEILNQDLAIIVELKNYNLLDVTEEFELRIVDNSTNNKKSHFRLLNAENSSRFYEDYDSERHDDKIQIICEILNSDKAKINFIYKDFSTYPSADKNLKSLSQYKFQDEVIRETEVDKPFARFDIFGIDNSFSTSVKRPEIIIEVVDENFQNKDLFDFLIAKTQKTSLLVIYYFMENENLYNKFIPNVNKIDFRISCYLLKGQFYYCGIPLIKPEHKIESEIDNEYSYYNYVEQKIIKPIKKGQKININELKSK